MIAGFILISSMALAALFTIAWLVRPGLRKKIEAPKYAFQAQLQAYNRQLGDTPGNKCGRADESD